jgi:CRP-like cAMP-binding protein
VEFFKNKEASFIMWVGSAIRPVKVEEGDYVYKEGEKILEMYFIVNGEVSYVLPRFGNAVYITKPKGCHFGHEEIMSSRWV